MKKIILLFITLVSLVNAAELKKVSFEEYLSSFDL